jgi:ABC-type uncharacterized transport system substrate-binding protein
MTAHRLPGMSPFWQFVEEGGLLAYGPDYTDMYRRAAAYVAKILKGAKPADLPTAQPSVKRIGKNKISAKRCLCFWASCNMTGPDCLLPLLSHFHLR